MRGLKAALSSKRKSNFSLKLLKVGLDVTFGIIGVLMGGTIGVGTVVEALSIGPVTQYMFRQVNHLTGLKYQG